MRFEQVDFGYAPDRRVLSDLDLEVPSGCQLAIVGASGSGKSSLVRLLLRLYVPHGGCIRLDGIDLADLSPAELRSRVGVVPQEPAVFSDTMAANIRLGRADVGLAEIERAARAAQLHDFIAALPAGYDTAVGERGLRLSGGERQRLALARVLLRQPDICVFDEATSMLDGQTEAAVLDGLRKACGGRTTITIAHRLTSIQHADAIVVLAAGRVVERGRHAELLSNDGPYAALWRAQMRGAGEAGHPRSALPA